MGRNWLVRVIVQGPTTITGGRDGELKIDFAVKMWHSGSPNMANITITNPAPSTVAAWKNNVGVPVTLSAGFEDNCGVIFAGQIKQVVAGHQNAVDSFMTAYCADSDSWYRKQNITKTLGRGWTPKDRLDAVIDTMKPYGITLGVNALDLRQPVYPRGTPLIGMAREHLRHITLSAGGLWSIQNGKLMLTGKDLDTGNSSAVTLTAATGLVGYPTQTEAGVTFQSLINPALQPLMKVTLDPSQIIEAEQNNNPFDASRFATNINLTSQGLSAGTYTIYAMDRAGSTRGSEFFDTCICIGEGGIPTQSLVNSQFSILPQ